MTVIAKLTPQNLRETIDLTLSILLKGGIVAYPTETFYGLAVRFDDERALGKLFDLKRRPDEKALPLIIGRVQELALLTDSVSDLARCLIRKFWPGPLTLLFKARPDLSPCLVYGGTVAVRVPGESFALALARDAEFPVTATSANPSGLPPADSASRVTEYFDGFVDLIIDGGKTPGGSPSTIVDVSGVGVRVVREGAVAVDEHFRSSF